MSGCDHSDETAARPAAESGGDAVEPGRIAYRAYGDRTGWRNFRGEAMPGWDDLGEVIRDAWRAAAAAVGEHLTAHAEQETGEVTR